MLPSQHTQATTSRHTSALASAGIRYRLVDLERRNLKLSRRNRSLKIENSVLRRSAVDPPTATNNQAPALEMSSNPKSHPEPYWYGDHTPGPPEELIVIDSDDEPLDFDVYSPNSPSQSEARAASPKHAATFETSSYPTERPKSYQKDDDDELHPGELPPSPPIHLKNEDKVLKAETNAFRPSRAEEQRNATYAERASDQLLREQMQAIRREMDRSKNLTSEVRELAESVLSHKPVESSFAPTPTQRERIGIVAASRRHPTTLPLRPKRGAIASSRIDGVQSSVHLESNASEKQQGAGTLASAAHRGNMSINLTNKKERQTEQWTDEEQVDVWNSPPLLARGEESLVESMIFERKQRPASMKQDAELEGYEWVEDSDMSEL